MPTITCPHDGIEKTLGPRQMVSAHRSRAGVVTYYRCHCGDLVLDVPRSIRHVQPDGVSTAKSPPRTTRTEPVRCVHHYLGMVATHADRLDRSEDPSQLHEFVSTLVKAATVESDAVTVVVPALTDPPVTLLRAVARLAHQTAGERLPVCPALADRLDELSHELM